MNIEMEVLCNTVRHISEVSEALSEIRADLEKRGIAHDRSKLEEFEFDTFTQTRPRFKKVNFGTPEYDEVVKLAKPAVEHHYKKNRHHTSFYANGFNGMNLLDILEMLADWKAASRRSPDLSFKDSLPRAYKRYNIPKNMQNHIEKTLQYLGWI